MVTKYRLTDVKDNYRGYVTDDIFTDKELAECFSSELLCLAKDNIEFYDWFQEIKGE